MSEATKDEKGAATHRFISSCAVSRTALLRTSSASPRKPRHCWITEDCRAMPRRKVAWPCSQQYWMTCRREGCVVWGP